MTIITTIFALPLPSPKTHPLIHKIVLLKPNKNHCYRAPTKKLISPVNNSPPIATGEKDHISVAIPSRLVAPFSAIGKLNSRLPRLSRFPSLLLTNATLPTPRPAQAETPNARPEALTRDSSLTASLVYPFVNCSRPIRTNPGFFAIFCESQRFRLQ